MKAARPGSACATPHRRRQTSYGVCCLSVHACMQPAFFELCKYIKGLQNYVQLWSSPDVITLFFLFIVVSKGLDFLMYTYTAKLLRGWTSSLHGGQYAPLSYIFTLVLPCRQERRSLFRNLACYAHLKTPAGSFQCVLHPTLKCCERAWPGSQQNWRKKAPGQTPSKATPTRSRAWLQQIKKHGPRCCSAGDECGPKYLSAKGIMLKIQPQCVANTR